MTVKGTSSSFFFPENVGVKDHSITGTGNNLQVRGFRQKLGREDVCSVRSVHFMNFFVVERICDDKLMVI